MKKILLKLSIILGILILSINIIYSTNNGNNNENKKDNLVLKDKYSGKKLDRITNSVKGKKEYRFLIQSEDSLEEVKEYFTSGENNAKIKKLGNNKYMVRLPLNTQFLLDDLSMIDNGILPSSLGRYDIIEPEIVESLISDYVLGEETDKLWGLNKIGASEYQQELQSKERIKVAILDTGISYNNEDLDNNYNSSLSYDFINNQTDAIDDNGHGTEVAGVIGAEVNGTGVYGVNSNTDLISLKVLDSNGLGTSYDILEAIDYALLNNIKVLNMSFGGTGESLNNPICESITNARNNGLIIVTSAGNNNSGITNTIPASCDNTITVGAIDQNNNKTSFSNYGTGVTIFAPGVNIYTTTLNNTYKEVNGTSFSAAFVTGLVAKELAFSGEVAYSSLANSIKNNYGLVNISIIEEYDSSLDNLDSGSGTIVVTNDEGYIPVEENLFYINSTPNVAESNLIGYWDFNQCSAKDLTGNSSNGIFYGSPTCEDSKDGKSIKFGGINDRDYIVVRNNSNIALSNNFTYNIWFKVNGNTSMDGNGSRSEYGHQAILAKAGDRNGLTIRLYRSGVDGLWYPYASNGRCCSTAAKSVNSYKGVGLGERHMVTLSIGLGYTKIYLDGEIQDTQTSSYFNLNPTTVSQNLQFGIGQGLSRYPLNGSLDEVKLFNKALSDDEVRKLYGKVSGPFIPGETIIDYLAKVNTKTATSDIISNWTKGDPINLNTGEFTYENTLMQYSSKGFPFEFSVNYRNRTSFEGIIGNNFDHSYNLSLQEQSDGNVYYYDGKLGVFEFVKNTTGFDYNKTIKAELKLVDGKYNLIFNNSKTFVFNSDLKIESIRDNFGNTFNFIYDTDNLIKIIDSNQREYNLIYNTDSKLQSITDFAGNKIEFVYFTAGETNGNVLDLKTIRLVNGITSKEINFVYNLVQTDDDFHNIVKLIDSENNIYVENTYDINDRVTSQMYGSGTINYTYTIDADNKITQNNVIDRELNNVVYSFDTNGNTTQKIVKKVSGDSIYNYEYNSLNYLIKETKPLGNGYTYTYDTNNNLIEKRFKQDIIQADSSDDLVYSYTYDTTFNKPLTITLPNGLKIVLLYDTNGNLTKVTKTSPQPSPTGEGVDTLLTEELYEYNTAGELIKKIDPKLNETSFEYTNGNLTKVIKGTGLDAITTNYNYDAKGNITSITDGEGHITQMTYDDFNLLNKITTPENIVSQYTYNNLNKKTNEKIILSDTESVDTSFTYDILDNPTNITTDLSATKTKTIITKYDKNSNIIETKTGNNATNKFEYDAEGNITKKTTISSTLGSIITTYIYDENNRLVKVTSPQPSPTGEGVETIYSYNLFDQITKITDTNGTYSKLEYNKAGNITKREVYNSADILLQQESYTYDIMGRELETIVHDIQNNKDIITKKAYDKNNNIIKTTDPKGTETNYTYDQFDRLTEVTDTLGNIVQNTYNKNNKVIETKVIGTNGKTIITSYEYDSDNRLTKKTDTNGIFETYTYNKLNQISEKKDKDNGITYYTYDYAGNVLSETHEGRTIYYEYNDNSKLTKVIDANNNVTNYTYDDLGNLTKIIYPDQMEMLYEYDKLGNLTKKTDPNGTIVINNYDSQNRLTSRSIQAGTGVLGVTSENYSYDVLGRLVSATDSEGNDLNFTYDSLSRLTSETNSNLLVNYTYDDNGNTTSINDVNYTYDVVNRLTSVKNGTQNIANNTYDSLTQLSQTLGNGVTTNYTYDELNRLKTLNNYSYTYNTNGNITNDGKDVYTYDNQDRITGVNYDQVNIPEYNSDKIQKINYDSMGNRTTQENYTLKNIKEQVCYDETVVEDVVLANGKTKTIEKKVRNCETAITQVEKQKNTISYITDELNQYTKLENRNKNNEIKKEFTYKYDNNGNLIKDDIN